MGSRILEIGMRNLLTSRDACLGSALALAAVLAGCGGGSDDDVAQLVRESVGAKKAGHGINSGHFLPEEAPEETYGALHRFFGGNPI